MRTIGDATVAAFFSADKPKAREKARAEVDSIVTGRLDKGAWETLHAFAARLMHREHPLKPFHWQVEFPEVFARENGGFDAVVGNPPFHGGKRISSLYGESYGDPGARFRAATASRRSRIA